jgi:hypothetical protein
VLEGLPRCSSPEGCKEHRRLAARKGTRSAVPRLRTRRAARPHRLGRMPCHRPRRLSRQARRRPKPRAKRLQSLRTPRRRGRAWPRRILLTRSPREQIGCRAHRVATDQLCSEARMRHWTTSLICALFGCGTTGGAQPDSSDGAVYGPDDAAVDDARFDRAVADAAIQRAPDAAGNSCVASGGVCATEGTCPVGRSATSIYGLACGALAMTEGIVNPCCITDIDAAPDVDAAGDVDSGGGIPADGGPFACGSALCAADEWCVYPCCGSPVPCTATPDGSVYCPCETPRCSKTAPSGGGGNSCSTMGRDVHCTCG